MLIARSRWSPALFFPAALDGLLVLVGSLSAAAPVEPVPDIDPPAF